MSSAACPAATTFLLRKSNFWGTIPRLNVFREDYALASSKEAATETKDFYTKLKSASDSGGNLSGELKKCMAANLILVNALEKIEGEVGKGKPSKEQLKAIAEAVETWADTTVGAGNLLDTIEKKAAAASKARGDALKALGY